METDARSICCTKTRHQFTTLQTIKRRLSAVRPDWAELLHLHNGAEPLFEREALAAETGPETVEAAIESLLEPRVALPSGAAP